MNRCSRHGWKDCTVDTCQRERARFMSTPTEPISIPDPFDNAGKLGIDSSDDLSLGLGGVMDGGQR